MFSKSIKILVLLLMGVLLAACGGAAQPTEAPVAPAPAATQACPEPVPCPTVEPVSKDVPFEALWAASAHAKADAAAFTHWDEETPQEIPVECAKCHSSIGFQDYVGADGSEAFKVDASSAVGTVVTCSTCHNDATKTLSMVKFPSGVEISGLGGEAVCMTCHQGNASMVQVDEAIAKAAVADEDTVSADLGFTNIHYFAAAVARYGTLVKGGYEYAGKTYDALFDHVQGVQTCTECHDSHSLELKLDSCASCHEGVATPEDVRNVRMIASSATDYDGDGDLKEGIFYEVEGVRALTFEAIQTYAVEVSGSAIAYSSDAYPYFFVDTNANGTADADEAVFPNAYKSWTPRLLKAAYNYQTSIKDPGAYAHGGKYIIQLLYDSAQDLNTKLATPVDLSKAQRNDPGHFAGSEEAFRHWDGEDGGIVPKDCVKCHTGMGLPQFIKEGTNISMSATDGLVCETCHSDLSTYARYEVASVRFPSGAVVAFEDAPDNNLCLNCHQGRESSVSVTNAVKGLDVDVASDKIRFRNVHYFAAGATLFGTDAKGVYEYPGKTYVGKFEHDGNLTNCTSCHDAHALMPNTATCKACHGTEELESIRMNSKADYDGDGDTTEGVYGEIEGLSEVLYAVMQAYAKDVVETPIVYSPTAYPYFFADTNGNGLVDTDEKGYASWTPRLLEAGYNYQYVQKDPGAYVHNAPYVIQVLVDSIQDLNSRANTKVPALVRP